jgi:hypothetical protein
MIQQKDGAQRWQPPAPQKITPRNTSSASNLAPSAVCCNPIDPWSFIFESWRNVIAGAPIKNKRLLLSWMSRDVAAAWADACRQQAVDDMWQVADELGLIKLLGTTHVQAAIAAGFERAT